MSETLEEIVARLKADHAREVEKLTARAEMAEYRANNLLERLRAAGVV